MTRPFDPQRLQFYLTIPSPCPYLDGQMERKIFTQLDPLSGPYLNNYLTHAGFRRSQNVIYRPACENCRECKSLRILAQDFVAGKSFRRTLASNSDLTRTIAEPLATAEQFALLQKYLLSRHAGGGMSDMDFYRYEMMVEQCASDTEIVEYRDADNVLIAAVLIDVLQDGLSMVYSFFDPETAHRSLGNYMILDQLDRCQTHDMAHLYLGYWVSNSQKMSYKARFQPCEILGVDGWHALESSGKP